MSRTQGPVPRKKPSQAMAVLGICAVVFIGFSLTLPGFLSFGNLLALARNISILGVLALGMAIVVIARGLDLSQVASMACSTAVTLILMNDGWPTPLALAAGLCIAVAVGLVNGWLISVVEMPALLTTLASGLAVLGITRSTAVQHFVVNLGPGHEQFLRLGGNLPGGVPASLVVFVAAVVLVHLFLSRTVLGRFIYAHGDNPEGARLTGLPTRPLTMLEYALCAGIGYVGGVVMIAQTALMHLQVVEGTLIFDVILVVVLGGVSLTGGRGNVASVVVGTLLIGVLLNGMTIMDLDIQTQNIVKGIVLLGAIVLDSVLHPRDEETSKQGD
ncbi:monosaccharide ABC transporter membrane protein (CUT2 family) [Pseudacidovorax intermedius]|uniref:Monosaccharide ABC transporter membrane protein (CUT2 family) n=1 Tax=Pseudacidovorax intermedius TaxID=433924 RepID=A0A370F9J5_9BURK|nr:ABC transporter permease [Pseudacidovorax intermedius]RDI19099.1 monosaccharide ABC transporter membrane protein (CUT2 family) [Pseudacidovorax intermedius]